MKNNVGKINGTFVNIGNNLYFFMRMKNPKTPQNVFGRIFVVGRKGGGEKLWVLKVTWLT